MKITISFDGLKKFLPDYIKNDQFNKSKEAVVILARVRWIQPVLSGSGYDIGVSFDGMDDGDKLGVSRYIKDKLKDTKD